MIPKSDRKRLAAIMVAVSVCLLSSLSGTLAWYQISTKANVAYGGASVGNDTKFQIGLKSEVDLVNFEDYGLSQDAEDSKIYWANGNLNSPTVMYFLESNGYATNVLNLVTASETTANNIKFIQSPSYLENSKNAANKTYYIRLNYVFRMVNLSDNTTINDKQIYLSDIQINGEGNAYRSARMYYVGNNDSYGLVNLSEDNDGVDTYGGILDLNLDGYYDAKNFVTSTGAIEEKEINYGYYTGEESYGELITEDTQPSSSNSTFDANHQKGVYPLDNTNVTFKTQAYKGRSSLVDSKLTLTTVDDSGYASLDTYIFLEGWDKYCIDNIAEKAFGLSLSFESK
jgi:hypothetical protein